MGSFICTEIGVSAEEQTLNSSMTEEEFFTWLKSRGISDEDCNALSGKYSPIECTCTHYSDYKVMKLSSENGVTQSGCTQLDAGDFDDLGLTKIGKKLVRKYLKEVPAGERMTFNSFMSKKKFFKWLKSWGVSDKDCNTLSGKFSLNDNYYLCYSSNYGDGIILREWCYSTWIYSAR